MAPGLRVGMRVEARSGVVMKLLGKKMNPFLKSILAGEIKREIVSSGSKRWEVKWDAFTEDLVTTHSSRGLQKEGTSKVQLIHDMLKLRLF